MSAPEVFARVDKGELDPVELAVLVAVLVRRAQRGAATDDRSAVSRKEAHWRRLERVVGFADPRGWQVPAT
ncbi:acyl-CoA carboxylase subunit epsilon [Streptomyces mirabilis]|uniref:acyl-CoA carboxylase subunit epsilon n=1 Tax=Streptomyces mirabilis TaxID=68239 RepID=UPI0022512BFA|nr:acyl-CoA carboxylase subunit epsilon [Streptomyces mirabilis]MCX4428523.1 acyl-CoA carboxylase subunit epsilon [Streptomyces mirabilis]